MFLLIFFRSAALADMTNVWDHNLNESAFDITNNVDRLVYLLKSEFIMKLCKLCTHVGKELFIMDKQHY